MTQPFHVKRACNVHERRQVLQWMISCQQENFKSTDLDDLLDTQANSPMNWKNLFYVTSRESDDHSPAFLGVILLICQEDSTATLWPPVIHPSLTAEISGQLSDLLIQRAQKAARDENSLSLQAILPVNDLVSSQLFTTHGIPCIGTLLFMQKPADDVTVSCEEVFPVADCSVSLIAQEKQYASHEFARLLEQTYHDSLDFPELLGKKTGTQAVKTHQLQGEFDPAWWFRIDVAGEPAGVLLFTRHREWNQWELTYLGILPKFRRQGLGRYVIAQALSNVELKKSSICLGVDARNQYAIRLYRSLGFVVLARQHVHFSWLVEPGA